MALQEAMFAMQITSDLLSHARSARERTLAELKSYDLCSRLKQN